MYADINIPIFFHVDLVYKYYYYYINQYIYYFYYIDIIYILLFLIEHVLGSYKIEHVLFFNLKENH